MSRKNTTTPEYVRHEIAMYHEFGTKFYVYMQHEQGTANCTFGYQFGDVYDHNFDWATPSDALSAAFAMWRTLTPEHKAAIQAGK